MQYGNEAVTYLREQCRPKIGAVAPGDLGGTAHKPFRELHQGDKIRGDKVLKKTNLEDDGLIIDEMGQYS